MEKKKSWNNLKGEEWERENIEDSPGETDKFSYYLHWMNRTNKYNDKGQETARKIWIVKEGKFLRDSQELLT